MASIFKVSKIIFIACPNQKILLTCKNITKKHNPSLTISHSQTKNIQIWRLTDKCNKNVRRKDRMHKYLVHEAKLVILHAICNYDFDRYSV